MYFSQSNQAKKRVIKKQASTQGFKKEIGLRAYVHGLNAKLLNPIAKS